MAEASDFGAGGRYVWPKAGVKVGKAEAVAMSLFREHAVDRSRAPRMLLSKGAM